VLYQGIRCLIWVLLLGVPLGYCLWARNFCRGFWVTWIIWICVWFIMGILITRWALLVEKATGDYPDCGMACTMPLLGLVAGWLPGLMFGAVGEGFGRMFRKRGSMVKSNETDI